MSACSPFTVEEGAGWVGIDLCGTPLIPSDARGSTDVDVVQAQLVLEAVRALDTGARPFHVPIWDSGASAQPIRKPVPGFSQ
jgi:hypothetical protein